MIKLISGGTKKRIYLSGPITGIKNCKELFDKKKKEFERLGFTIINPMELFHDSEVIRLEYLVKQNKITEDELHNIYMKRYISEMVNCDFIALMNGYEKSKGCKMEIQIGIMLQIPIMCAETLSIKF